MLCSAAPKASLEFPQNRREGVYPSHHSVMIEEPLPVVPAYRLIELEDWLRLGVVK